MYNPKFDHHKIVIIEEEKEMSNYLLMSEKFQYWFITVEGSSKYRTRLVVYIPQTQYRISTVQARAYKLVNSNGQELRQF
jgi:hypothetical protein